jgi:Na+/H+ antiporter NhaD/arsenite permease-like protein
VILYAKTPGQLLTFIIFLSGVLSAIFLNDTIVLVFTPLVLEITTALKRNPIPYLVATATAANVGSTATIIGNPQNMIIGIASGIPFTEFAFYLTPAALGGLVIVWFIVVVIYRKEFKKERLFYPDEQRVRLYLPLFYKSIIASVLMMLAFILGVSVPLAALGGASLLLITRRLKPERVFREIDWSLLVFFAGLFVVTAAVETSGLSKHLFAIAIPFLEDGLFSFSITAAVISNLVSNVPAVLLFKPVIPLMADQNVFWLTLGMATTFAGNLTLLGSVANLIVAESAKSRGVHLSFTEYLKAGIPITIFTLLWGILWMGFIF